eukprot:2419533-Pyramimonas_sp.AAC.1
MHSDRGVPAHDPDLASKNLVPAHSKQYAGTLAVPVNNKTARGPPGHDPRLCPKVDFTLCLTGMVGGVPSLVLVGCRSPGGGGV